MPRRYEIEGAFREAVRREANGRRTVTTVDFVEKLAAVKGISVEEIENATYENAKKCFGIK